MHVFSRVLNVCALIDAVHKSWAEIDSSLAVVDDNFIVYDLWRFMAYAAGWRPGQPMIGSFDAPQNPDLKRWLLDGKLDADDGISVDLFHFDAQKVCTFRLVDMSFYTKESNKRCGARGPTRTPCSIHSPIRHPQSSSENQI